MFTNSSQHQTEPTTVPSGTHSASMVKGEGRLGSVPKRLRKFLSTDENTPRDDDFTQLDIDTPATGASVRTQPVDTGQNDDTSDGSTVFKD